MKVGEIKVRDPVTKVRIGTITVNTMKVPKGAVHVRLAFGHPEIDLEIAPDIANTLADLLMEATGPRFQNSKS